MPVMLEPIAVPTMNTCNSCNIVRYTHHCYLWVVNFSCEYTYVIQCKVK